MITVQQILNRIHYFLQEDNGLTLGVVTDSQVVDFLSETTADFLNSTQCVWGIANVLTSFGVGIYPEPDYLMGVEVAQYNESHLNRTTTNSLDMQHYQWKSHYPDTPRKFHEDQLPSQMIELFPTPILNGNIIGATGTGLYGTIASTATQTASLPNTQEINMYGPASGFYGTISSTVGECYFECSGGLYGAISSMVPSNSNLTMVGPVKPPVVAFTVESIVSVIPDIFQDALMYGTLEKVFTDLAETRDPQRAMYCKSRYEIYVQIGKSMMGDISGDVVWRQMAGIK